MNVSPPKIKEYNIIQDNVHQMNIKLYITLDSCPLYHWVVLAAVFEIYRCTVANLKCLNSISKKKNVYGSTTTSRFSSTL